eukprot:SAG11_NODE_21745_length_419_cov_1.300000_1_plen_107_part_00
MRSHLTQIIDIVTNYDLEGQVYKKAITTRKESNAFLPAKIRPSKALMAASAKTKEKYKARPKTEQEQQDNKKLSAYFEAKLTTKIDESKINKTHPSMAKWAATLKP